MALFAREMQPKQLTPRRKADRPTALGFFARAIDRFGPAEGEKVCKSCWAARGSSDDPAHRNFQQVVKA